MRFNLPLVIRIPRYFRTDAELLWDRRSRFDRIFGSGDTRKVERAPELLQESWALVTESASYFWVFNQQQIVHIWLLNFCCTTVFFSVLSI